MNVKTVLSRLNELASLDPVAMEKLVSYRVSCSQGVADHPTAQVGLLDGEYIIGMLGVINALLDDGIVMGVLHKDGIGFLEHDPLLLPLPKES